MNKNSDVTDRLEAWAHAAEAQSASDLMDEAAKEIRSLRKLLMDTIRDSGEWASKAGWYEGGMLAISWGCDPERVSKTCLERYYKQ